MEGSKSKATTLKQSDRYLLTKFNREFILAIQSIRREMKGEKETGEEHEFDINSETYLDYEMYKQVLYRLGLIQDTSGIDRSAIEK